MIKNFPRILFFIAGATPTDDEFEAAQKYLPNMAFRNAAFVPPDATVGSLEQCDGVAGLVPEIYAKNRATAEEAGDKFMQAHSDARQDRLSRQDKARQAAEAKAEAAHNKAEAAKAQAAAKAEAKPAAKTTASNTAGWKANQ